MERWNNAASCFRFPLLRIADAVHLVLEKQPTKFAVLFSIVFLSCTIAIDLRSRMWIDELYTLQMAGQASPGDIVRATLGGSADGAPPLIRRRCARHSTGGQERGSARCSIAVDA